MYQKMKLNNGLNSLLIDKCYRYKNQEKWERVMNLKFSVLMSVYKNEKVDNFELAVKSVIEQTNMPDEIIIVRDGMVPTALQSSIDNLIKKYPKSITYIPLNENTGLGNALNIGIQSAKYDLIARMDTDDICVPNRFELQLKAFQKDPELDMVGGQVTEFSGEVENIVGQKKVPCSYDEISSFLKFRNAFNHPTVMYKKTAVLKAGNYLELRFVEDYYLWCRMFLNGAKMINLPETLVRMRVGLDMYQRRGGYAYYMTLKKLEKFKREQGMITPFCYYTNVWIRFMQCVILPNRIRGWMYRHLLREQ